MVKMHFEVGKFYEHATGKQMAVITKAKTTMYGKTLLAEQSDRPDFVPVGFETDDNWKEITEDEWMKNFSD